MHVEDILNIGTGKP